MPKCVVFHESLNDTPWRMGTIVLEGDPAQLDGTTVTVDNHPSRPVSIEDGEAVVEVYADDQPHKLKITKDGFLPFTAEFLATSSEQRFSVNLQRRSGADDPQRRAAEMVIERGGSVDLWTAQHARHNASKITELPQGRFAIAAINLYENKKVTDAGCDAMKGIRSLEYMMMDGTNLSDSALSSVTHSDGILNVGVGTSKVSTQGVSYLSECTDPLTRVALPG